MKVVMKCVDKPKKIRKPISLDAELEVIRKIERRQCSKDIWP
jgi:hypothetical protein